MMLSILLALAAADAAPAKPVTARAVVERQLAAKPRRPTPTQSAAESERIRARHLERIGQKLERPGDSDGGPGAR